MSVARYSREELQRLFCEASGVLASLPFCCMGRERLAQAIRTAYYANRAAVACTYNEEISLKPFEIEDSPPLQADKKEVFRDICLLTSNCISSDGRNFLPREDKDILEGFERSIAYRFIEEA